MVNKKPVVNLQQSDEEVQGNYSYIDTYMCVHTYMCVCMCIYVYA